MHKYLLVGITVENNEIRRVLIVADAAHATPRISEISAILPTLGWESVIVTCNSYDNKFTRQITVDDKRLRVLPRIIKTENFKGGFQALLRRRLPFVSENLAAKVSTWLRSILFIPDEHFLWQLKINSKFKEIKSAGPYGIILSSSSPVSTHIAARRLSRRLGIPWVADLRDLWSDNHNYSFARYRKLIDSQIERAVLREAQAITTVNQPWRDILASKYGQGVTTIENACKFHLREDYKPESGQIRLSSLGPVYPGKHNLERLLHLLKDVQKIENHRIVLDIYGDLDAFNRTIAKEFKKNMVEVNFHTRVSHEESWKIQCTSDLLVLFTWESTSLSMGHVPLRSYEFAACKRPIIVMTDGKGISHLDYLPKGDFHQVSGPLEILNLLSNSQIDSRTNQNTNLVDHSLTYTHRAFQFVKVFERVMGEKLS